jgi:DNA replication protein DnaC
VRTWQAEQLISRAAIPPRFAERTLEGYRATLDSQKKALAVASAYAERFEDVMERGSSLMFVGKPGTGKTHLACGIANKIMKGSHTALYVTVPDMIRSIRSTWRKDSPQSEEKVLEAFAAIDLLILDEVGVQHGTESEQVTLFEVINRRYERMRPMIVISNLPIRTENPGQTTLQSYLGDRAFDRLREGRGKMVVFDWFSYRRTDAQDDAAVGWDDLI